LENSARSVPIDALIVRRAGRDEPIDVRSDDPAVAPGREVHDFFEPPARLFQVRSRPDAALI